MLTKKEDCIRPVIVLAGRFATDEELAEFMLDMTTLYGQEREEYRARLDLDVARQWLVAQDAAEVADGSWRVSSWVYHRALERSKVAREEVQARLQADGYEFGTAEWKRRREEIGGEAQMRFERAHRLYELSAIRWKQSLAASSVAFNISRRLFRPVKEPCTTPKPRRTPEEMVEYWSGKLSYARHLLTRAQGRLERLEAEIQKPDETAAVAEHFHLGMVGGSGRAVKSLNKKRERALDRAIKLSNDLKAARSRVSNLESRVARYAQNLQKWQEKAE